MKRSVDPLAGSRYGISESVPNDATRTTESPHGFAPNMPTGAFDVFVSVGQRDGTPKIALPLPEHDGHRRYKLGKIDVLPE